MSQSQFKAFADDAAQVSISDGFAIENGTDAISIHGDIEIRIDKVGLAAATALRDAAQSMVDALSGRDLPARAAEVKVENGTIASPF